MRILFMGTPDFALPSLKRLIADGHEIVGVCCQPDKPQGRHFTLTSPPAKKLAQEYGIPVFQPKTLGCCEAQEELFALKPDLIVVAAFGKILPKAILDLPPKGCINVHGSILPKYRGAAPIQWAVINDDVTAGVTIMQMAEGLDTGDMLLVKTLTVGEHETAGELFDRIAELGADALSEAVNNLDALIPVPQNEEEATWAPMLKKTDGEIDWSRDAKAIYAQIRGVTPWPGAYTTYKGKRLKVHKARVVNRCGVTASAVSGEGLIVACGSGALELLEVQLEGAKRMSAEDFIRGQRITEGTKFGE